MAEASSTDDVITLRIRFKSETLERFIERYGGDLGPDQVFVRTRQPLAIGTSIAFDFTLNDGSPLLAGRGTVVWARSAPDASGPAGMGVQFTSLPAASWQTLRRVLAARADQGDQGENEPTNVMAPAAALSGAASGPRRSTTPGTPAIVAKPPEPAEDAERTEVARMPPNFFETASDAGVRNLERARERPRPTVNAVVTPPRGQPAIDARAAAARQDARGDVRSLRPERPEEFFENLSLEEVEEVTGPLTRPATRRPAIGTPAPTVPNPALPARPGGPPAGEPPWASSRASAYVPQAGVTPPPSRGTAAMPAWTQPTPPRGATRVPPKETTNPPLPVAATTKQPTYPYDDPVSSTAPTLPATAAVLLYDPDDPQAPLQPAAQARPAPAVPFTAAPPPPASAQVLPSPMAPGNAYQEGFYPPAEEAGGYPEVDFDPAPYAGPGRPTGGRATVGRIGPAISPEEMALAATAVRGMEGEAPVWPGVADEPRRGGTAKIWLALVLAAGGVIVAVLWLVPPLMSSGFMRTLFSTDQEAIEPAPQPGVMPTPAQLPEGQVAPAAGTPPGSTPESAAPSSGTAAPDKAAPPPPAGTVSPPAEPAPPAPTPAAPEKDEPAAPSKRGRAALAAGDDAPAPRARRRRRDPSEVIAEAEARAKDEGVAALPSPGAGTTLPTAAVPEAAPTEGAAAEDIYWLSVRSTPTGADVIIDGQAEGKTPFTRRIFDPTRTYALVVRKPGFTSLEKTVTGTSEWTKRGNVRTLTVTARLDPVAGAEPPAPAVVPAAPPSGRTNPFDEPVTPPPVPRP